MKNYTTRAAIAARQTIFHLQQPPSVLHPKIILLGLFMLLFSGLSAQIDFSFETPGKHDYVIPSNVLSLTISVAGAYGGDAGFRAFSALGGNSSLQTFVVKVGNGSGQLPVGTLLRLIVGKRGFSPQFIEREGGGGGGGGSAVLYKLPNSPTFGLLAVSGGGGGAYARVPQGPFLHGGNAASSYGADFNSGFDGSDIGGLTAGKGGKNGAGGTYGGTLTTTAAGGGGGIASDGGTGNVGIGCTPLGGGKGDIINGNYGEGGDSHCVIYQSYMAIGGLGFGGGGEGVFSGGGGGGYSGGGGGGAGGAGGAGGGYINRTFATSPSIQASPDFTDGIVFITLNKLTVNVVQPTCPNLNSGSITIPNLPAGAKTKLNNGAFTVNKTVYSGLPAGTYTVTVSELNHEVSTTVVLNSPIPADPIVTVVQPTCSILNSGAIRITNMPSGATSKLNNGAYIGTTSYSGLAAGTYTVTVMNRNCVSSTKVVTLLPASLPAPTVQLVQPTCASPNSGSIRITNLPTSPTIGSSKLNNGAFTTNKTVYTGLSAGTYTVTIKQGNCTSSKTVTLNSPYPLVPAVTLVQPTCFSLSGGSITITNLAAGASTKLNNGVFTANKTVYSGLTGGTYVVTISRNNCESSTTINLNVPSLTAPNLTVIQPTCAAPNSGSISINNFPTGGAVQLNNGPFVAINMIQGLSAGTYVVTIKLGNCTSSNTVTLNTPCSTANLTQSNNSTTDQHIDHLSLKNELRIEQTIDIYPNPATNEAFVNLQEYEGQAVSITLSDVSGKTIQQDRVENAASTPYRLDLKPLQSGLFFVKVQGQDGNVATHKLQVLK